MNTYDDLALWVVLGKGLGNLSLGLDIFETVEDDYLSAYLKLI